MNRKIGDPDGISKWFNVIINECKENPDRTVRTIKNHLADMLDFLHGNVELFGLRRLRSVTFSQSKDSQGDIKRTRLLILRGKDLEGRDVVKFAEAESMEIAIANWFTSCSAGDFGWKEDAKRDAPNRQTSFFDAVGSTHTKS